MPETEEYHPFLKDHSPWNISFFVHYSLAEIDSRIVGALGKPSDLPVQINTIRLWIQC
jgi:hypothetical protein